MSLISFKVYPRKPKSNGNCLHVPRERFACTLLFLPLAISIFRENRSSRVLSIALSSRLVASQAILTKKPRQVPLIAPAARFHGGVVVNIIKGEAPKKMDAGVTRKWPWSVMIFMVGRCYRRYILTCGKPTGMPDSLKSNGTRAEEKVKPEKFEAIEAGEIMVNHDY